MQLARQRINGTTNLAHHFPCLFVGSPVWVWNVHGRLSQKKSQEQRSIYSLGILPNQIAIVFRVHYKNEIRTLDLLFGKAARAGVHQIYAYPISRTYDVLRGAPALLGVESS